MARHRKLAILMGIAVAAVLILMREAGQTDYRASIEAWRQERIARLTSDEGWLTVAGLFWLKEGPNRFGTDPGNEIVLPAGSAPARAGTFELRAGRVSVRVEEGVAVTSGGRPVKAMDLRPDLPGPPDMLVLGDLTLFVIKRQDRFGIRLRDKNSPLRKEFTGLTWFPIREKYRVTARWVPYDPPREIEIPNVLGQVDRLPCPGYASFTLDGKELRLEPVIEVTGDKELFYIFRDETAGKETYPAGRFFYSEMPKDGKVVLDFNKAYNPPCAFTPYATCPLPPPQNRLPARIEAGEKRYGRHGAGN